MTCRYLFWLCGGMVPSSSPSAKPALVGDVGDELPALLLGFLQGVGHGVESLRQLDDLIHAASVLHPCGEVALSEAPGGLGHILQGLCQIPGADVAEDQRQAQHHQGDQNEQRQDGLPHVQRRPGVPGHEQISQHRAAVTHKGGGHGVMGVGIKVSQSSPEGGGA